ncbi:hypothetical protein Cgig2_025043 [Carnegiea gigantea]|uniref:Uncharacterized protein n=1 Tax=Carnegiea gigantea TaxID=171969 RepID=A0A9Q1JIP0_9CARY|nr:hypothetical protein Cgig2_025043 [Carnegiea gigantea]
MADIEPSSFSLGLDLDLEFESEPQHHHPTTHQRFNEDDNEEEFQLRVSDSDLDNPTPTVRRLRRGGPSTSKLISTPTQCSQRLPTSNSVAANDDDDDIQDFSSEELATAGGFEFMRKLGFCEAVKLGVRSLSGQAGDVHLFVREEDPPGDVIMQLLEAHLVMLLNVYLLLLIDIFSKQGRDIPGRFIAFCI